MTRPSRHLHSFPSFPAFMCLARPGPRLPGPGPGPAAPDLQLSDVRATSPGPGLPRAAGPFMVGGGGVVRGAGEEGLCAGVLTCSPPPSPTAECH